MSAAGASGTRVVSGALHRVRRGRGKRFSAEPPTGPSRRPARVAVALALAHTIQRAIDRGEIRDQAEAARRLGVTRARISQVIDLTFLAPDLQEKVLVYQPGDNIEPVTERNLRVISHLPSWMRQRDMHFIAPQGSSEAIG